MYKLTHLKGKESCDFCEHGDCDNIHHHFVFQEKDVNTAINKTVKELVDEIESIYKNCNEKRVWEIQNELGNLLKEIKSKFKDGG